MKQRAVNNAAAEVEAMLMGQKPPLRRGNPAPPPPVGQAAALQASLYPGLDAPPDFDLPSRLKGPGMIVPCTALQLPSTCFHAGALAGSACVRWTALPPLTVCR
jgi:hypothetical protein